MNGDLVPSPAMPSLGDQNTPSGDKNKVRIVVNKGDIEGLIKRLGDSFKMLSRCQTIDGGEIWTVIFEHDGEYRETPKCKTALAAMMWADNKLSPPPSARAEEPKRMFPIQDGISRAIPWSMISPHEVQCQKNHSQSIQRLSERGGLSPSEVLAVLDDESWFTESKWGNFMTEWSTRKEHPKVIAAREELERRLMVVKSEELGFVVCEFGPDSTTCDECNVEQVQLYYRRTCHDVDDGECLCLHCISKQYDANEKAMKESNR